MTQQPLPLRAPIVTLPAAVRQCLRKYANFSGRATRGEFWWWFLAVALVNIITSGIQYVTFLLAVFGRLEWIFPWIFSVWAGISFFNNIFLLTTLLPTLAVTARRLHDIGKTGWWQLVWWSVPLLAFGSFAVLFAISISGSSGADLLVFNPARVFRSGVDHDRLATLFVATSVGFVALVGVSTSVLIWSIIWVVRQGHTGSNHYGPDPRALDSSPVTAVSAVE